MSAEKQKELLAAAEDAPGPELSYASFSLGALDSGTRTGHNLYCPADIEAFSPGEFYANCIEGMIGVKPLSLLTAPDGALTVGEMNPGALTKGERGMLNRASVLQGFTGSERSRISPSISSTCLLFP